MVFPIFPTRFQICNFGVYCFGLTALQPIYFNRRLNGGGANIVGGVTG